MAGKYYWLIERHNPQFEKQYYVKLGNITVKEAKKWENSIYGYNNLLKFSSEIEYENIIQELLDSNFRVA